MKSQLFAQEFQEHQVHGGFGLQNERLLKVTLSGEIMARQGAAVAWQGNVEFAYQGAGAKQLITKLVTGEDLQLMKVSGQGDVFLADYAAEVHVVYLENDSITVNGDNVLAFDSSLSWDLKRVKGFSGMSAQGLANVEISGTGAVALTTIGNINLAASRIHAGNRATTVALSWTAGPFKSRPPADVLLVYWLALM